MNRRILIFCLIMFALSCVMWAIRIPIEQRVRADIERERAGELR